MFTPSYNVVTTFAENKKLSMVALSKRKSVKLTPRQHCALKLFIAKNRNVNNAAGIINIPQQILWKIVENRSGSEFYIFTLKAVIEPFLENLLADKILEEITEHWRSVDINDLTNKNERRQANHVVECKQVACHLMSQYTKLTYINIAERLGYKDIKMVIWSIDRITEQLQVNKSLQEKLTKIQETINQLFQ